MSAAQNQPLAANTLEEAAADLEAIPALDLRRGVALSAHTRFGIGGPADLFADTNSPEAFSQAVAVCRSRGLPYYILGDGTNVIVSDAGFRGLVLRFTARGISRQGAFVEAAAGAALQRLVDFAIDAGLAGLETLTGIPGSVGAALYGNAGAYGHSISERVEWVRFFDGSRIRRFHNEQCRFAYRESRFKHNKRWTIFECGLRLEPGDRDGLKRRADEIAAIRDKKFPPSLRCAGSIFKNLYVADLPAEVAAEVPEHAIREGKVASAYFLEQVGAKGMRRGGIAIASYHANLIYNDGGGAAAELRELIQELKQRIRSRFGFEVEEEVQYIGDF